MFYTFAIHEDPECDKNVSYYNLGTHDWNASWIIYTFLKPYFNSFQWLEIDSFRSEITLELRVGGLNEELKLEAGDRYLISHKKSSTRILLAVEGKEVECDGNRAHLGMELSHAITEVLYERFGLGKYLISMSFDIFEVREDEVIARHKLTFFKDYFPEMIKRFFEKSFLSETPKLGVQEYVEQIGKMFNAAAEGRNDATDC